MTPRMIREIWELIEETQSSTLLTLDDNSLVTWIVSEMDSTHPLDRQEADTYSHYVRSRLPLIRDVVDAR